MTTLASVSAGATILHTDLNQYKSMLEGASGYTTTYLLVSTSGTNFIVKLGDAAGANKFAIQDSAGVEQWSVNSDGAMTSGVLTPTSLTVPTSAAPAQTTAGQAVYDTVKNALTVGDGVTRIELYGMAFKYKTATQVITTSTTYADVIASGSSTFAFNAAASGVYIAEYYIPLAFGGSGGVKFQITGPAAPTAVDITGDRTVMATIAATDVVATQTPFAAVTGFSSDIAANNSYTAYSAGIYYANNPVIVHIRLRLLNGANAGNVTLQAAQNSSAGTTTLGLSSTMIVWRLA